MNIKITDPKIRGVVRGWAEVNGISELTVYHDHSAISFFDYNDFNNEITFYKMEKFGFEHLKS